MAKNKSAQAAGPLKIAGGVVILGASIALMVHRMPHRQFVEVHADKPRPASGSDSAPAIPAPAPVEARPAPMAAVKLPPKPALHAAVPAPLPQAAPAAPSAPVEPVDLAEDCRSEAAVLCYGIPERGFERCLRKYDDALMRPCRLALRNLRSARSGDAEEEAF